MTKPERINEALAACSLAAQDCKGSADYAGYSFSKGNEEDGRRHFANLTENFSALKSAIASLDYAHRGE